MPRQCSDKSTYQQGEAVKGILSYTRETNKTKFDQIRTPFFPQIDLLHVPAGEMHQLSFLQTAPHQETESGAINTKKRDKVVENQENAVVTPRSAHC